MTQDNALARYAGLAEQLAVAASQSKSGYLSPVEEQRINLLLHELDSLPKDERNIVKHMAEELSSTDQHLTATGETVIQFIINGNYVTQPKQDEPRYDNGSAEHFGIVACLLLIMLTFSVTASSVASRKAEYQRTINIERGLQ